MEMHNISDMQKVTPRPPVAQNSAPPGAKAETIWCAHFECYKQIAVCNRCRVRIKCIRYQDYWNPRLGF